MEPARRHAAPVHRGTIKQGGTSTSRNHPGRRGLRIAVLAGAILGVAVLTAAGVTTAIARHVITPPRRRREGQRVLSVDREASTITLSIDPDSVAEGRFGLWFAGETGHAKVGPVVARDVHTVTRELVSVDKGTLTPGVRARLSGWYYRNPAELGVEFENVEIPTELGPAPAWRIDPETDSGRWVIMVHGRGVDRRECLRAVPTFHELGFTSLLVSYRNDGVAPSSPDGLLALGDIEWRDVDAALRYARRHGAREVILMGWSMGGATVLQAASRSKHISIVRGLILESPVVDWVTALEHQAGVLHIPRIISMAVFRMLSHPWGRVATGQASPIDLKRLDFVARAVELRLPMLILHSSGDRFVPNSASRALAEARPDIVTFPEIDRAGHTRVWNHDPVRWRGLIHDWVRQLQTMRPSAPAPGASSVPASPPSPASEAG